MAWYEGAEPVIRKSPLPADEPEFEKLARQPLGDVGLLHLRWATPGMVVNDRNTHPFNYGSYAFAHNGAVHPQHRLSEILAPEWEARVGGTTESERYLLLIMSKLQENGGDAVAAIPPAAPPVQRTFPPHNPNPTPPSPRPPFRLNPPHPPQPPPPQLRRR